MNEFNIHAFFLPMSRACDISMSCVQLLLSKMLRKRDRTAKKLYQAGQLLYYSNIGLYAANKIDDQGSRNFLEMSAPLCYCAGCMLALWDFVLDYSRQRGECKSGKPSSLFVETILE